MSRSSVDDALAALSLANLSLIGVWNAMLNYTPAQTFFFAQPPSRAQYAAAMTNVFLIGLVFFVGIRFARRARDRYGVWGSAPLLILMSLPAANAALRLTATSVPRLGRMGSAGVLALLCGAFVLVTRRFFAQKNVLVAVSGLLIALSPLIAIEAVVSISRCRIDRAAEYANGALALRGPQNSRPRIVWIIFDELDYRLSFPDRPPSVAMPQFDRLRAQSVFAENAVSPSAATLNSVPSLLTGVKLSSILFSGPAAATADGVPLTSRPTIFSTIRGMGGNAAAAGWYLPYCRLFNGDLAACSWHEIDNILSETNGAFAASLARQQQSLFEYGYYSIFRESLRATHRIHMLNAMHDEALRDVVDPSLNLVFLHFPLPHPPFFYDRVSRTFTKRNSGPEGYWDGLALADIFLGDIRGAMTQAGLWDTTTVLVSSDHQNRSARQLDGKEDSRVPFLLKLAGQRSAAIHRAPLHTVVTKPLLEAIFDSQVESPEEAVAWLTAHSQ